MTHAKAACHAKDWIVDMVAAVTDTTPQFFITCSQDGNAENLMPQSVFTRDWDSSYDNRLFGRSLLELMKTNGILLLA